MYWPPMDNQYFLHFVQGTCQANYADTGRSNVWKFLEGQAVVCVYGGRGRDSTTGTAGLV